MMNDNNINSITSKSPLGDLGVCKVNAHIHSPFSFSAFSSIQEAVEMAKKENVQVLGINDFYTGEGFPEFHDTCVKNKIFPLFNIEFIGLISDFQNKGIRVNDPGNPGRIYFSGKGLDCPFKLNETLTAKLNKLITEANLQVKEMVAKANAFFKENAIDMSLEFEFIKKEYAVNLVRERHVAKAIRIAINEKAPVEAAKKELIKQIYSGTDSKVDVTDNNALENEIRGMLLKKGGPAFVPEDENAFLSVEEIIEIVKGAGGIPCYPVLLDDKNGNFTDFEGDWEKMHKTLLEWDVHCIELIPGRNTLEVLTKFMKFFSERGYIIQLGTEHNTPELIPVEVSCGGGKALTDELLQISYEGACVVAQHQFLRSHNKPGFTDKSLRAEFAEAGDKLIQGFLNK